MAILRCTRQGDAPRHITTFHCPPRQDHCNCHAGCPGSVMAATLANRQDATSGRTRYHAGVVRPGEWPDGEKNDVRYP